MNEEHLFADYEDSDIGIDGRAKGPGGNSKLGTPDSWGHPVDQRFRPFSECPTLSLPHNGDRIFCDQATCALG